MGIPPQGYIRLQVAEGTGGFQIDLSGKEGYIIGRSDRKSSYIPDIDLAVYRALDKGVSRRHAALVRYQGHIHILDLNSINGTFLNGERLTSDMPYLLSSGDKLRVGNFNLVITHYES
jgi:pSer/pThr/pTyr-binding forkhead associated (FHA) protein